MGPKVFGLPNPSIPLAKSFTRRYMLTSIQAALENEKNIHSPNSLFPEAVVDIYCGDTHPTKKNVCRLRTNPRDPNGPKVTQFATSWVSRGWFYNTYNVLLCDRFFNEKTSLESILHDMSTGAKEGSNASEYKFSWGHTIYHELMHLNPVISNEEVWDPAYGACPVAKLANQNGCSGNILWTPPRWDNDNGDPHSLINADSWAFYASGAYFQKGANLTEPGRAINDCGIYSGENLQNFTASGLDYAPEGIKLPDDNRTDGTYYSEVPPDPAPENTPPDDPPTPSLPYVASDLPSDLATPFDAAAYFATFTPASVSFSTVPSPPPTTLFSSASRSTTVPMVTYPCSTMSDNQGIHCKCGPFAEDDSPALCPPSTVVAGPSIAS